VGDNTPDPGQPLSPKQRPGHLTDRTEQEPAVVFHEEIGSLSQQRVQRTDVADPLPVTVWFQSGDERQGNFPEEQPGLDDLPHFKAQFQPGGADIHDPPAQGVERARPQAGNRRLEGFDVPVGDLGVRARLIVTAGQSENPVGPVGNQLVKVLFKGVGQVGTGLVFRLQKEIVLHHRLPSHRPGQAA